MTRKVITYKERLLRIVENNRMIVWFTFALIAVTTTAGAIKSVFELFPNRDNRDRNELVKQLVLDVEKVKLFLPSQQSFTDCLDKRGEKEFALLEACMRERRALEQDPLSFFDKNISLLKLSLDLKKNKAVVDSLERLKYLSYEMQNNQVVFEYWIRSGCSLNIKMSDKPIIPEGDFSTTVKMKCALVVQSYDRFLTHQANSESQGSPMRKSFMPIEEGQTFIAEGSEGRLDDYFNHVNGRLIAEFNSVSTELILQLKEISAG